MCSDMLPHSQWLRIVKFQNECTLRGQPSAHVHLRARLPSPHVIVTSPSGPTGKPSADGGASGIERKESYLSNTLLSNMLFDRDFPLGVESCVLDNP